ncbi:PEP-CTERM sorting domain-containing protein [Terriglobus saanensis]|uniref:Ice-binding protein C-terminal domain-containing protein n=1 Tax=Terriglobus saanensis (strain ATCC BAA-1853 / DSM 23119 / SP1PR4) TaxID=401053 RepID=E8V441_TERSS|nr:PEP-CTERM sorting domain-containing protein [Terriglobus saanensis]ADV82532.1 protein of unknown function DUF1555 [Terriglobus saanensis SP1PR4]
MKRPYLVLSACFVLLLTLSAGAESISSFTTSVTSADSTQLGRPSRNGIPQDWTGTETYPGVINPTITYYFQAISFSTSLFTGAPDVEITSFDPNGSTNTFISAYAGSYDPNNRTANWLGDGGFSGNVQTGTGGDFQVILPVGMDLILVINSTLGGTAGLNSPIQINVDAFADTMYDDPVTTVTPEPATLLTLGTGLFALAAVARRRLRFGI